MSRVYTSCPPPPLAPAWRLAGQNYFGNYIRAMHTLCRQNAELLILKQVVVHIVVPARL
jgi:hypothetical protein